MEHGDKLLAEPVILGGWGVHVLLLASEETAESQLTCARLADFGCIVEEESDFYIAAEILGGDQTRFGLFVMDCDALGGLAEGRRLIALLRHAAPAIPVILLSSECGQQYFPEDERQPVILRKPLSVVSLRVGFSHAMRHRLVCSAA
ncbi:MAG: hypothetical protein ACK5M4_01620 [Pseudorhodobacter sp.]